MLKIAEVDKALVLKRVVTTLLNTSATAYIKSGPFDIALDQASCSIKIANPDLKYLEILKLNLSEIARRYCSRYPLEPRIKIAQQIERSSTFWPLDHPKSITLRITFRSQRNDDVRGLVLSYVAQHLPEQHLPGHVNVLRMANRLRVSWRDSHGDDLNGWIEFVGLIMQFKLRRCRRNGRDVKIVNFSLGVLDHVSPETFSERVNQLFAISMDLDQWATDCLMGPCNVHGRRS